MKALRLLRFTLPILAAVGYSAPADAQEYPFSGNFGLAGSADGQTQDDLARCALGFFTQDKSGAFVNYHVDMDGFKATKTLRYVKYANGSCTYDAARKLETCDVAFDTEPKNIGAQYVDVVDEITDTFIKISNFDTKVEALAYSLTGATKGRDQSAFVRCPFDPSRLAAAITDQVSTLTADQSDLLIAPDDKMLHDPVTIEIMKAAGLSKP